MNNSPMEPGSVQPISGPGSGGRAPTLPGYLHLLLNRWRLIAAFAGGAELLTGLISLFMPRSYAATCR